MKKLIISAAVIVVAAAALFIIGRHLSSSQLGKIVKETADSIPLESYKIGARSYNFFTKTSALESLELSFQDGALLKIETLTSVEGEGGNIALTKLSYGRDNASFKADKLVFSGLTLKDLRGIKWASANTFAPLGAPAVDYVGIEAEGVLFSKGRFELTAPSVSISKEVDGQRVSAPEALILMNGAVLAHFTDIEGKKSDNKGIFAEEYALKSSTGELFFTYSLGEDGSLAKYALRYKDLSFYNTFAEFYGFLSGLPAMDAKAKVAEMVIKALGSKVDGALVEESLLTEGFEMAFDSEAGLEIISPKGLVSRIDPAPTPQEEAAAETTPEAEAAPETTEN